ncbi:MAG TPA: condensation domain-containing protein [Streptosporangiaceae bacterium]
MDIAGTSGHAAELTADTGRYPLSANLELLCMFDKGDEQGALGPRHLMITGWRVTGPVSEDRLTAALDAVIARHEMLRTKLARGDAGQYQEVHPPAPAELDVIDLPADADRSREELAEEFVNRVEGTTLSFTKLPHIKAVLGRFDPADAVLVLVVHHAAGDGYTMNILVRDLAACYAAIEAGVPPQLPEPRQYRQFAAWQRQRLASPQADASRQYWRQKLHHAELTAIPMDLIPPTDQVSAYATHRFLLDAGLTTGAVDLARARRCSPFMVLLAAFEAVLYKLTGVPDVVAPTMTSGRGDQAFAETVGAFFNLIPLRTDLTECDSFTALVDQTRSACLEAYSRELPFGDIAEQAPELTRPYAAGNLAVITFQLFQFPGVMNGQRVGSLEFSEIRRRLLPCQVTTDIPNGVLWTLDILPSGEIAGHIKFNKNEFLPATMIGIADEYQRILANALAAPGSSLDKICRSGS